MGVLWYVLAGSVAACSTAFFGVLLFSAFVEDGGVPAFGLSFAAGLSLVALFSLLALREKKRFTLPAGIFLMVGIWGVLSACTALPFFFSGVLSAGDALFEGACLITTTGFSLLSGENLAPSLILWQSVAAWLGGLTFIAILVTVLPEVSGCFGLTLTARQTVHFSYAAGRLMDSLRQGAGIYLVLTCFSFLLFLLAGLDALPALRRAMLLISSTGWSAREPAGGWLGCVDVLSMVLAGGNLLLYWKVCARRDISMLFKDTEMRVFLSLVLAFGVLLSLELFLRMGAPIWTALNAGFFYALSFVTTTGIHGEEMVDWTPFAEMLLFLMMFVGASIGSAGGGLKVMRVLVLFKMTAIELRRTLHPRMVAAVRLDGGSVPEKIQGRLLAFFFLYLGTFLLGAILLSLAALSPEDALFLSLSCISSTGGAVAILSAPIWALPAWAKFVCALLMMLGRMEIFSFFVLLAILHGRRETKW